MNEIADKLIAAVQQSERKLIAMKAERDKWAMKYRVYYRRCAQLEKQIEQLNEEKII